MAPPGVIAPHLEPGAWHELWMVMDQAGYRVWIDGEPVYHAQVSEPTKDWRSFGAEEAELWVGGFVGLLDHVRIWEKK